ncbi:ATP-binding cassette domain-containing protein, partial [Maribacter polysaccharolyticus]|uniref:ATP-binding cassette domain-containing protein n=1 Tax=Maribacter polysaccharolyticus TaxID=3020831 RepID=UPI00237F961B
ILDIIYGELIPINKSVRINNKVILTNYRNPKDLRYLPQYNFIPKNISLRKAFNDFQIEFSLFSEIFPEFKNKSSKRIEEFSSGECRLIGIFLILKSDTKFCLLDEPFSYIMPKHVETLKKLILAEKEKGIIISDHLYDHILDVSDTLYFLSEGNIFPIKSKNDLKKYGYLINENN